MTLTIVQARMTSRRLPGKALERVGGKTILEWVLHRLSLCTADIGRVVVATSTDPSDDPIAELCATLGVACFRGSLDDVLDRFHEAAGVHEGDPVIRVTADCPLLCPRLLDRMVAAYSARPRVDYVTVDGAATGLGQEMFSRWALDQAWRHATTRRDREHVVTWMLDHPAKVRAARLDAGPAFDAAWHLNASVDTPADLDRLRSLHASTGGSLFDLAGVELVPALREIDALTGAHNAS